MNTTSFVTELLNSYRWNCKFDWMSMNSNRITDWIQIITGFAVLLGIGLVVFELRQNKELTQADVVAQIFGAAELQRGYAALHHRVISKSGCLSSVRFGSN